MYRQCFRLVLKEWICRVCSADVHDESIDLCLECTMLALFFSRSLIHSMMHLFLSMILFRMDMSLFFMFTPSPCTKCMPLSKSFSKSCLNLNILTL